MKLEQQNVLFFARTMGLGGTENVVLQLCEIFKPLVSKVVVCSCGGVNEEKLIEMGIKHYKIGDIENKNFNNIINNCKTIRAIISDENITVIHTQHRMATCYVRLLGLNKYCQFINTSHNTFSNKRLLTRYSYKGAHLIACGEMVKKNLVEFFGFENVTVVHNAVKPFEGEISVDPVLIADREGGKFLIGNIGRLTEQKGMDYYIQAMPGVIEKHPEAQFYIIGSGEDEEKLKNMSEGLPVKFLGYRADIQNIMSQLDLVVLSSLWEGFPLTPIEAFSVGKTIVATGVDGTLEIVKDGDNGLLVRAKNTEELTDKINWMIENKRLRKCMETNARQSFIDEFSFDVFAGLYTEYYRSL